MKYRNKSTGKIYNNIDEVVESFCHSTVCQDCPLYEEGEIECDELFINKMEELEFEEIEGDSVSNLAKALGVKDKQEWYFADDNTTLYRINYGAREVKEGNVWRFCNNETDLAFIISYPHLIHPVEAKENDWTEREVEIAMAVKCLFPNIAEFNVIYGDKDPESVYVNVNNAILLIDHNGACPNFISNNIQTIKMCDILKVR